MSTDTDPEIEAFEGHDQTRAAPWVRRFFGFFGIMTGDDESSSEEG